MADPTGVTRRPEEERQRLRAEREEEEQRLLYPEPPTSWMTQAGVPVEGQGMRANRWRTEVDQPLMTTVR